MAGKTENKGHNIVGPKENYLENILKFVNLAVKTIKLRDDVRKGIYHAELHDFLHGLGKNVERTVLLSIMEGDQDAITETKSTLVSYLSSEEAEALADISVSVYSDFQHYLEFLNDSLGNEE